jgi:hypothetical protein
MLKEKIKCIVTQANTLSEMCNISLYPTKKAEASISIHYTNTFRPASPQDVHTTHVSIIRKADVWIDPEADNAEAS